ncbi:RNA polymerase sigma-70 factor [uncultured Sunxiuqinia sp.]|uniref:RNA polymerase sigma factor n=1 Tax=uncultured Sunxiuqinia sp. TaxID=1573825 RepID=UPI002630C256|nr:RNA polymerase sigma-70 factor [uncultured Sunxiuqinia sp.]
MPNNQTNNELELIQKFKNGDSAAFDALFALYASKLFNFVNKYLDLKEEAEEIVQDVFLNLWKHKKEIRSEKAFKSYLYQIALNNIRNYFNKKLVQEKHKQLIAQNYLFEKESDADELDYESVIKEVDQLIDQLPPKRKEIFLLSRKEGLDISEIANYLNISEATVKNQITSAVAFLKKAAKESGLSNSLFLVLFYR